MNKVIKILFVFILVITLFACSSKVVVEFETNGGNEIHKVEIEKGTDFVLPMEPEKEGYNFVGWYLDADFSEEFKSIDDLKGTIKLYAKWEEIKKYTVEFKNVDLNSIEVIDGDKITKPADPIKEGFVFIGWYSDETLENVYDFETQVNNNLTLYAKFEEEVNKYDVVFKGFNGEELATISVVEGDDIPETSIPNAPIVEGYEFKGWDKDLSNITSDLEINAVYEKLILELKVEFKNVEMDSVIVIRGEKLAKPIISEKEGYVFGGWFTDESLQNAYDFDSVVTDNLVLYAKWDIVKLQVIFKDKDGNVISEQEVEYGNNAIEPVKPEFEGYEFISWDNSFENVKNNIEINGIYDLIKFNVTIETSTGEIIKVLEVEYGSTLEDITPLDIDGYKFIGWSEENVVVKSDMTLVALYEAMTYSIKYKDGDNELDLSPNSYKYGEIAYLPDYSKDGKFFAGWFDSETNERVVSYSYEESGNKEVYAKWEDLPTYKCPVGTFTFKKIKSFPHSSNPNLIVFQPDFTDSGAPNTGVTAYNWSTGDSKIATISAYSTISIVSSGITYIKAELKSDPTKVGYILIKTSSDGVVGITEAEANKFISYKVTFKDIDGNVLSSQTVKEGGNAVVPDIPLVDGKVFDGWNGKFYDITKDTEVQAKYRNGTSKYAGKTLSILGDSMSTYQTIVPDGYSCFYPYPTADVNNYNDTWWMQVANRFGMKLLMNNSYSGTCVSTGTGSYSTTLDSRLANLLKNGEKPDVIIIFMGANDCGSQYVQLSTFKSSYKTMLEKIQKLCPESEIICLTLPKAKMYSDADRADYSKVIMDTALEYNCKLINLENSWDPTNFNNLLCDSIHPKKAGMDKIFETIYYSLRK